MARKPRMLLGDMPCHIIQRGNNRQACFYERSDYIFYLDCLKEAGKKFNCAIHAYVLMTNHVHLLVTPRDEQGVSKMMQSIGRRYVQYFNYQYKRSGTLWEGRFKASAVQSDNYLLACYRYIEMNPVRALMVDHPSEYRWSSYRANAGADIVEWILPHQEYCRLGAGEEERAMAYRELFRHSIDNEKVHWFTERVLKEFPTGNERFRIEIENALGMTFKRENVGRPRLENCL